MDSKKIEEIKLFAGIFLSSFGIDVTLEQVKKSHHDSIKEVGEPDEPFEANDIYEAFCDCYLLGRTEEYRQIFESIKKSMSKEFIHKPENRFIKKLIGKGLKNN